MDFNVNGPINSKVREHLAKMIFRLDFYMTVYQGTIVEELGEDKLVEIDELAEEEMASLIENDEAYYYIEAHKLATKEEEKEEKALTDEPEKPILYDMADLLIELSGKG